MKLLEFKQTVLESGDPFDYKEHVVKMLKIHPEGIQIPAMVEAARIIGIINKSNERVVLEDADYKKVIERLEAWLWGRVDDAFIQFDADLRSAPTRDANDLLKDETP